MQRRNIFRPALGGLLLVLGASLAGPALAAGSAYSVHNLVSDGSVPADHTDPNLKNGWGVAFNPSGFVWLANNHTGTSTLYNGAGVPQSLVVTVPPAPGGGATGSPTGIVFSSSSDFVVSNATTSGASRFIFCTEDGTISGWAPTVDSLHALIAVNRPGSSYKGLALASNASGNLLYAADFRNARIDVFDKTFTPTTVAGGFKDKKIPARYAPFNIQALGGLLYVAYAKRDKAGEDEKVGPGLGFVDVFDTDGNRLHRLVRHDGLNAPWGVALAPAGFGDFGGALLVGNFGDGTISAYHPATGQPLGLLNDTSGNPLKVDGLWGMAFGNGFQGQDKNVLYFAAGPLGEAGGVYGSISLVAQQVRAEEGWAGH
jgi:uncharacterized protein (TIGR03118 family)